MTDKPISIRLGARRMDALEHYLAANPTESRNGVISGAVEAYLKENGYWIASLPAGSRNDHTDDRRKPTLSERVAHLEETMSQLLKNR